MELAPASVIAVHRKAGHAFSKDEAKDIEVIAGHGVRGDAHFGVTVKHRSRVKLDPTQPNLWQVHLLQQELLDEVRKLGHHVLPGQMGENVTTQNIDLLGLSKGTQLRLGAQAVIEITGLRNPCAQIDSFMPGLLAAVVSKAPDGTLIRRAGVMAVVLKSGSVKPGDDIYVIYSPAHFLALERV